MRHRLLNILLAAVMAAIVSVSPVWCAEKKVADASTDSVEALIDLLKAKGVLRDDEVRDFKNRLKDGAASESVKDSPATPAPPKAPARETPPRTARVPDEDIKAMIESLKNQGILDGDEAAGLARRLAPMGSEKDEAERAKPVVLEGSRIPYVRSTMPEAYLAAMINLLRAQGVAGTGEAEILNRRLSRKTAADEKSRAAEAGVASISSQIEQLRAGGVIGGEQATALLANLKETVGGAPPAAPDAGAPKRPAAETTRMPADDLKGMVDSLKDQGLLSTDEAAGLKLRFAPDAADPAVMAERRKPVVLEGRKVPYARTTMPEAYIRAMAGILQKQGVLLPSEVDVLQARYEAKAETDRLSEGIAREVTKNVREQLKKEVREEVVQEAKRNPIPDWTKRIRWGGDFRFRFEGDLFGAGNADILSPSNPTVVVNTHTDRYRLRLRARLNMDAQVSGGLAAGFRIATGTLTDPVSTNQTTGDYFNKKSIVLDRAYLKWKPVRGATVWGGRSPNPWFSTDLVWDQDLNFEGVAMSYEKGVSPTVGVFGTVGAFTLQEVEFSSRDKWLFGAQVGAQYQPRKELGAKIGLAFYDYVNILGKANDPALPGALDYTAPLFQQKGNTLFDIDPSSAIKTALASEYRELNLTGAFDVGFWHPVHFVFMGDAVKNIGFKRDAVALRTGNPDVEDETTGFQFGVAVGYPAVGKRGDWKGFLFYKRLEADAVLDAFTDSDFHLGGTNAQGWILGGEYGLGRNVSVAGKWISANEISGPPLSIDVLFVDLNVMF